MITESHEVATLRGNGWTTDRENSTDIMEVLFHPKLGDLRVVFYALNDPRVVVSNLTTNLEEGDDINEMLTRYPHLSALLAGEMSVSEYRSHKVQRSGSWRRPKPAAVTPMFPTPVLVAMIVIACAVAIATFVTMAI